MLDYILLPAERVRMLKKEKDFLEKLRSLCDVEFKDNEIKLQSHDAWSLLRIKEALKAFGRGFAAQDALELLHEDNYLEIIDLREFARTKQRIQTLRGRVIGREGRIKQIVEKEAGVKIAVYGKTVSVLGELEKVKTAAKVIKMILEGRKHGTALRLLSRG